MSGSCREAILEVRETLPNIPEWWGGYLGCPGVVGRLSRMSRSSRKALPDVQEWWGGPPGCPGVVWRGSRKSRSG